MTSQAIRYKRIINDESRLETRLKELKEFFIFSSYDEKLVDDAFNRVRATPRSLEVKEKPATNEDGTIYWAVSYGPGFKEARTQATDCNRVLSNSRDIGLRDLQLKVVPRRGPNLKDILFRRKAFSVSKSNSAPESSNIPCGRPRCKTCPLISNLRIGNNPVRAEGGSCTTQNCVYMAQCQRCVEQNSKNNLYIGKTTSLLSVRITGHRAAFTQLGLFSNQDNVNDKNCLWAHLFNVHGLQDRVDFEKNFKFCILKKCDPRDLLFNEQFFVNKFRTIFPHGLNSVNPIL